MRPVRGLTPVQFSIMTVAKAQPGLDQAALAQEVGVDRTTLANVLARLEGRGLVSRCGSPTDRRVKRVSLTRQGATLLTRMAGAAERAHDRTIAALPAGGSGGVPRIAAQPGQRRQRARAGRRCGWHKAAPARHVTPAARTPFP